MGVRVSGPFHSRALEALSADLVSDPLSSTIARCVRPTLLHLRHPATPLQQIRVIWLVRVTAASMRGLRASIPRPHRGTLERSPAHHGARPDDQQAAQRALAFSLSFVYHCWTRVIPKLADPDARCMLPHRAPIAKTYGGLMRCGHCAQARTVPRMSSVSWQSGISTSQAAAKSRALTKV